jgi:hypothetical protein
LGLCVTEPDAALIYVNGATPSFKTAMAMRNARQNRAMSLMGHSRPMYSVPVPINVRCYTNSDIIVRRSEVTLMGQQQTHALQHECIHKDMPRDEFTVAWCYDPIIHSDRFRLSSARFPLPLER